MSNREAPNITVQRKPGKLIVTGNHTQFAVEAPTRGLRHHPVSEIRTDIDKRLRKVPAFVNFQRSDALLDVTESLAYLSQDTRRKATRLSIATILLGLAFTGVIIYSTASVDIERPVTSLLSITAESVVAVLSVGLLAKRTQLLSSRAVELAEASMDYGSKNMGEFGRRKAAPLN